MKIALVGGGTGGHVLPLKALAEELNKENLIWIGEKKSLEEDIAKKEGIKFYWIFAGKFRRYITFKSIFLNIIDIIKLIIGFLQSIYILTKVDIVFIKGGYVCLPVGFAAFLLRKKIYIHESDYVMGLTNKILSKIATKVFLGVKKNGGIYVGQLISKELVNICKDERLNVLVIGGSQGARNILLTLAKFNFDYIFHIILGTKNKDLRYLFNKPNYYIYEFLDQKTLGCLYSKCHWSITRGGANSLAEQELFGLKKIIIPLPTAAGNHQYYNALAYNDIIILEDENFEKNLKSALENIYYFEKNLDKNDIYNKIKTVKTKILNYIF